MVYLRAEVFYNISMDIGGTEKHDLEQSVYDALRYFAIYHKPLTAVQIWRSLIVDKEGKGLRWHGHHVPALRDIEQALEGDFLRARAWQKFGYYGLKSELRAGPFDKLRMKKVLGKQEYVRAYLMRHATAQLKWKRLRRVVKWLTWIPFVKMLGGSGSLALFSAKESSDLDLFVIVKKGRIWTARLFLLAVTHVLGKRRKHWDRTAPNKVCLNHYVTDESLIMKPEIHNAYTAVLWHHVIPFTGIRTYREWMELNGTWIKKWLMFPEVTVRPSRLYVRMGGGQRMVKKWMESFLRELPGDWLEKWAERVQRKFIAQHTIPQRSGRVVVSNEELAFHPDTKVPAILSQFYEEEGQRSLL